MYRENIYFLWIGKIMIEKDGFRIRLLEREDLEFALNLREDSSTNRFLGTFCLLNMERQKRWFEGLQTDNTRQFLVFEKFATEAKDWERVGLVRISEIDFINRSMCVGGDISPQFRGKGYAKKMYGLIFHLGFNEMNMYRLWLLVMENNEVAKNLYKKIGFVEEGRQRQAVFRSGEYHDYIMMSILKGEYKNGN